MLGGEPTTSEDAKLWMVLGEYDDNGTCAHVISCATPTYGTLDPNYGWSRSGATYTLDKTFDLYGGQIIPDDLDCAFALVTASNDGQFLDLVGGDLKSTYAETGLQIASATLLPKEWITVDVKITNVGNHDTSSVVVTGMGKGVKVKKANPKTWICSGSSFTVPAKVKHTKKTKAPKRIHNGKYSTEDKRVTFQVTKVKITKFKVTAWALCGSAGRWEY